MLATELLFVYVYCLIDDAIQTEALAIPARRGPVPRCTDAELITIALVRHLLGRRSESGFLAEIRRDWVVLRLPPGRQGRPRLPGHPRLEHRARRGERARGRGRPAGNRAGPA